eukprot:5980507-Heterocapsa_arctica.AAC.1
MRWSSAFGRRPSHSPGIQRDSSLAWSSADGFRARTISPNSKSSPRYGRWFWSSKGVSPDARTW